MKHWSIEKSDGITILWLDVYEQSANVLSKEVLEELSDIISEISVWGINSKKLELPKGLIIISKKTNGFILGADIKEFKNIIDSTETEKLALYGQSVLDSLEKLPFPTVAAINGYALGGGLELAMSCTYRIATGDEKTKMGLPEVLLGIHPGFGGTVRLPRLIGDLTALDLTLTGKTIGAKMAKKLGLVDEVVPERYLLKAAISHINRQPAKRRLSFIKRLAGYPLIRQIVGKIIKRKTEKKANSKYYPAPYAIIDLWLKKADEAEEAKSIGKLLTSETSRNLVYLFLTREELKRKAKTIKHNIRHIHVAGAGTMGADIASWLALNGFSVSLDDQSLEVLAQAIKKSHEFFKKKLKESHLIKAAVDRLIPDPNRNWLKKADLVIEAIIENKKVKQTFFKEIEKSVSEKTILATNTSSIPLEEIAEVLNNPNRLIGLHFFNPVAKMELIEVVRGKETNEEIFKRALSFAATIDKLPIEVKSSPGFFVNRVLVSYLFEALAMLEKGIPKETIDQSAIDFGMPMGPFTLMDTIGLDICCLVGDKLESFLGCETPIVLREMVAKGKLGIKSKEGFYKYNKNGKPKQEKAKPEPALACQLKMKIIDDAKKCLEEGIIADEMSGNLGMVFGTGFAPFSGGPFGRLN